MPDSWSTDFRPRDTPPGYGVPDWVLFARTTEEVSGSELEDSFYLIGTPFPLMYHPREELIVVLVGGLLMICYEDDNHKLVLESGTTLQELVNAVENGALGALRFVRLDRGATYLRQRFDIIWKWEWAEYGRNRWQELKDRGGEVDVSWLGERPEKHKWWWSRYT